MKNSDKDYQNMQNQKKRTLRFTAEERAIMEIDMAEEGYSNWTAFVKDHLFGQFGEKRKKRKKEIIQSRDNNTIAILLKHYIVDMAAWFRYSYTTINKFFKTNVEDSKKREYALDKLVTLSSYAKQIATQFAAICIELDLPVSSQINNELSKISKSKWPLAEHDAFIKSIEDRLLASGEYSILDKGGKIITVRGVVIETAQGQDKKIGFILLYCKGDEDNDFTKFTCRFRADKMKAPEKGVSVIISGILHITRQIDRANRIQIDPIIDVLRFQLNK